MFLIDLFQSQNGLILVKGNTKKQGSISQFQSQNGLILVGICPAFIAPVDPISIPKWSDFSSFLINQLIPSNIISIPKWSDFSINSTYFSTDRTSISIPKWSDFSAIIGGLLGLFAIFQSQNGLILVEVYFWSYPPYRHISIPKWSDFSVGSLHHPHPGINISIPKWSDFSLDTIRIRIEDTRISIPKWSDFSRIIWERKGEIP